ncbi:hypothetical protein Y032_0010g990 [Ancylostoma ceylanicum]|uniref:Uncharacterized protein n=1 Tax=Ancylostoma ceylanicum TaxID=53326 RepID=A0A016VGT1_9BILA|nr:hypothetical protein Y032_0010g990 [Ancylostoma ceylanicum]
MKGILGKFLVQIVPLEKNSSEWEIKFFGNFSGKTVRYKMKLLDGPVLLANSWKSSLISMGLRGTNRDD